MSRRAAVVVFFGVVTCIWSVAGHATTEVRLQFSRLVARADVVVLGTVADQRSIERFFGAYLRIVTENSIEEVEVIKGAFPSSPLIVTQIGGRVADVVEWYAGMPMLEPDRQYVMFLIAAGEDLTMPLGAQGLYAVTFDPGRGQPVVTTALGEAVLGVADDRFRLGRPPVSGSDDTHLDGAMLLEDFLAEIRARVK